ncbi:hypothetical protein BH10PSE7_BH10PSE7_38720 [soil metagenome]
MIATASVLAWRLPMLGAMMWNPTPARRAEALLMITEKQAAFAQGVIGANAAAAKASLSLLSKSLAGSLKAGDLRRASDRIAAAAHKPADKAVKANARRLKGRKI